MLANNSEYIELLEQVKREIAQTRAKVASQAIDEVICMYWRIGAHLNEEREYGSGYIDSLSKDIRSEFPGIKGMNARNLRYMAKFAREVSPEILQTVSAKLSWSHNIALMDKLGVDEQRVWYGMSAIENGWSLAVLEHQIDTQLYERQALSGSVSNFSRTLPDPQSELASDADNPTIGLLLCKEKNDVVAEYTLQDIDQPIGVSEYRLGDVLPGDFGKYLPSPEDLQSRI